MSNGNIAIFASCSGTNAENLISYYRGNKSLEVKLIIAGKSTAGVIERAYKHKVDCEVVAGDPNTQKEYLLELLKKYEIDFIILAGYIRKIPGWLINNYSRRIINLHPALLPLYGGKGMYGLNVHRAVLQNKERFSGISIHVVNEEYDKGKIIARFTRKIVGITDPEELQKAIHQLEYEYLPKVSQEYFQSMMNET